MRLSANNVERFFKTIFKMINFAAALFTTDLEYSFNEGIFFSSYKDCSPLICNFQFGFFFPVNAF